MTGAKRPDLHTRISGPPQAEARCNLHSFREVRKEVTTMMGKPNSGMARGELRSTLS